jgi:hypothetical protein
VSLNTKYPNRAIPRKPGIKEKIVRAIDRIKQTKDQYEATFLK